MNHQARRLHPAPTESGDQPRDIDAVMEALAGPAVAACSWAASRLQALNAEGLAGLDSAISLQLAQLTANLRLRHAALNDAATAERAVSAGIDLPQALRADVQNARGAALPEAS